MANWYGTARSNYVFVDDIELLKEALAPFDVAVDQDERGVMFSSRENEYGAFPNIAYIDSEEQEDEEIEFSWKEHVMPYVKEGEVLIIMEVGAEKHRYITGYSEAYVRKGQDIQCLSINLNQIYEMASEKFGIVPRTLAEY